jgi:2,4-dienoyl-CoA reductase-like NADH-dependent reductase (Old Yellow Enzyme family)
MDREQMDRIKKAFVSSLLGVIDAGFDAAELHMGHGYLLSQFLSPITNRRKDDYGGSIEKRARYPLEIFRAMREAAPDFPLIVKLNMHDGIKGGITQDDCVYVINQLEKMGGDAVELTGGFTSKSPFYLLRGNVPLKGMQETAPTRMERITMRLFGKAIIKRYTFEPGFFLKQATDIRKRVKLPLIYLGGVDSIDDIENISGQGFEFIALGRPLIHDPDFITRLRNGEITKTGCNRCNECIVEMNREEGVRCVLNSKLTSESQVGA